MKKLLLIVALLACGSCFAAGDPVYLGELQARAQQFGLAQSVPWQRLLHYQPDRLGKGFSSTVSFKEFFNAPTGRTNAAAELDATLAVFFSDELRADEPSQCRFKARYEWLKTQLQFDPQRLPPQDCPRYETWATGMRAESMSVVFASNDLNSPASMFGHTLLRVDAAGQSKNERLLSYALNYAADGIRDGGLTYAYRGIAGEYTGYFSVYPYYEKVKEYARYEHRDLWEYPLRFSPEDTRRLLWHMWELRGVGSPYYFFSQNCSFQLLSLIEAARPDLDLTHRFLYDGLAYTIPIDTLRQLGDAGMLGEPEYRPANANRFRHHLAQLTEMQQRWVRAYARGHAELSDAVLVQASDRDRARMLETAHDQLYFLFLESDVSRASLPRDRAVLLERSRITESAAFSPLPRPAAAPDQGHASGRFSMGVRQDADNTALLLRLRPSYHDRLDPPAGFLSGGEIEFFDLSLLAGKSGVKFDSFRVVSVQAVSPRDVAFKSWSWLASGGARRLDLQARSADPKGRIGGYLDGGAGLSWAPFTGSQLYGFGFTSADLNHDAEKGYRLRAGLRLGFAAQWSNRFTQQLEVDDLVGVSPNSGELREVRLGTQLQFLPSQGLRLNLRYTELDDAHVRGADLLWQVYF